MFLIGSHNVYRMWVISYMYIYTYGRGKEKRRETGGRGRKGEKGISDVLFLCSHF